MHEHGHACVIGAGIIGVTAAWQLTRAGWQVTLVDAAQTPASGTSHANGGQLSYSYVAPLAEPGVLAHLPGWLLSRSSPLRFRPRLDPAQWRWCLQFLRACNTRTAQQATARMLSLSYLSRDTLAAMMAHAPVDFAHAQNGKLIVYRTPRLLDKARALVEYEAGLGARQRVLDADACVALEPALAPIAHAIAGAIYTPSEESGDCARLARGLFAQLQDAPGVRVRMGTRIAALRRHGRHIDAAVTAHGEEIRADHIVVAAGLHSRELLAPLGSRPPLYPLKGYSLSVPCADIQVPAISTTDYERRTVYAKLGDTLRIAAMVGIGLTGAAIEPDRIALLKRQVHELLPHIDLEAARPWAGERPATPGGLPIIGRSAAANNLWLNIGHGALGFTLACGSSVLLRDLMAGAKPPIDAAPFAPHGC